MIRTTVSRLSSLGLAFCLFACSAEVPSAGDSAETVQVDAINLAPQTLDEATDSMSSISRRLEANPEDSEALQALEALRPVLDRLNHLVARVEPVPGHVVSFYEPSPGMIGISELGPREGKRLLRPEDARVSPLDLYRRLTQLDPPTGLIEAYERTLQGQFSEMAGELEGGAQRSGALESEERLGRDDLAPSQQGPGTLQQHLTSADGPWWAANACFTQGNLRGCHPNWGGGGYAYANTKTSFFEVAPYSGDFLQVRFRYESSTKFTDAVFPGQWLGWWWHSSLESWPCGFLVACGYQDYNIKHHRWDILQASNDGFHWTYSFKWSCGNTLSCDSWPN